jgi:hypothetical protein
LTAKQRVKRAIAGEPVDRFPVTAIYTHIAFEDHFAELTGEPAWRVEGWKCCPPQRHLELYRRMVEGAPFEILQPWSWAPSPEERERVEFVLKDGLPFRHDRTADTWTPVEAGRSGYAHDDVANEHCYVKSRADIAERTMVIPARESLSKGKNGYIDAVVAAFGRDHYIMPGGVTGTLYCCHRHVGLTNLYALLADDPDLIHELSAHILEQNIEEIRRLAAAGGDAIFIDDAMTTADMISPKHYARFCLPTTTAMVDEIHRAGHQAIVIYFGSVMDRLDLIAETGADALCMECSMKGYVNDITEAARRIGKRMTLFSNIDPVKCIQKASDKELDAEIRRQVEAGRNARGMVLSPASPITPATTVARMRRFIERSRALGKV